MSGKTLADISTGPDWLLYLVVALFAVISLTLLLGRGSWLIAGYNTASAGKRERWNEKALCRGTGTLVLAITACIELSFAGAVLGRMPLLWTGLALTAAAAVGGVVYLNTSRRFKK